MDNVEQIVQEWYSQPDAPETGDAKLPKNFLVIMNESFADMAAAFPNLELSTDPLSFYHSMKENTIKGTMITSVYGGGTANIEFEYLTGDSLNFIPSSAVAYNLYIYDSIPTLVSQAENLGYATLAFHPYIASGWNRPSVYKNMGFDRQWFETDVRNNYQIRGYVSDQTDYEQLFRATEETDGSLFVHNVTMQNHSSYVQGWNNLERTVEALNITGLTDEDLKALYEDSDKHSPDKDVMAQYFSLIQASDDAIRNLIEYYSASDEPTMIVFFGDHQPPLSDEIYCELYGKKLEERTLEETFQQYSVPFFIWANYDIPEQENVLISSNYLGALSAKLAGFSLTPWQKLQLTLMEVLPVGSINGFITNEGAVIENENDLPAQVWELYKQYQWMGYNFLFDKEHHPDGFFE